MDLPQHLWYHQIELGNCLRHWIGLVHSGPSHPTSNVSHCDILVSFGRHNHRHFVYHWFSKRVRRQRTHKINRRRCYVPHRCFHSWVYSFVQEKNPTDGIVFGMVNWMGLSIIEIHVLDSGLHFKHSGSHCSHLFPTFGIHEQKRPNPSRKRHLPHFNTKFPLVIAQHNRVHLGVAIPQRFM